MKPNKTPPVFKSLTLSSLLAAAAALSDCGYGQALPEQSGPPPAGAPQPAASRKSNPASPGLPAWLQKRREQQFDAAKQFKAFWQFQFTDQTKESGITFEHHAVADANKLYKAIHYDHGNGLAVADVDGDGLPDLYFISQLGGCELWRNLGKAKFENITETAGVRLDGRVASSASFADIDNDGDPDLFVTTVRFGNVLFENLGGGRFRDISREAGVDYTGHSSAAVFFDFDNDGRVDLFLANLGRYTTEVKGPGGYYLGMKDGFSGHLYADRSEPSILYKNLGERKFKDVSKEMHLQDIGWTGDAAFADLNRDGFPDLYVLNMQGDDHYYENAQGKSFVEKTQTYFPKTPWGAMGIKFFDFNQDGLIDLFITDMHSDMTDMQTKLSKNNVSLDFEKEKSAGFCAMQWTETYIQGSSNNFFGNAFFINQGNGRFEEVSEKIGAETLWPWGISAGDLNADGYEDVMIPAGMGYGFRYGVNSVLLNEHGERFFDAEFLLGVEPRLGGRTTKVAYFLDCSGEDKGNPLCAGHTGKTPVRESLSSRSAAMVDLDNDGDLDLVTNDMNDRPQVLISNLAEKKRVHCLKIKLAGARSNRDGLGATVQVHLPGRVLTQFHDGKSGYLSQSSLPLYFGLGEADHVDRLEITWPSGKKQIIDKGIPVNALMTLNEGD